MERHSDYTVRRPDTDSDANKGFGAIAIRTFRTKFEYEFSPSLPVVGLRIPTTQVIVAAAYYPFV